MQNTRDLAAADLRAITESEGVTYTLINGNNKYPVIGTLGDIGSLVSPISGAAIQGRVIEATVIAQSIIAAAGKIPARGWKAQVTGLDGKELTLFVQRNEYDRTVGVCRLTLGLTLKEAEGEI